MSDGDARWVTLGDVFRGERARQRRERERREFIARVFEPDSGLARFFSCRLHGAGCHIPAGYDREHSDSQRPYTVDELAAREWGPHYGAYESYPEYRAGWELWRALRRDGRLTAAEYDAVKPLRAAELRRRLGLVVDDAPEGWRDGLRQVLRNGGFDVGDECGG